MMHTMKLCQRLGQRSVVLTSLGRKTTSPIQNAACRTIVSSNHLSNEKKEPFMKYLTRNVKLMRKEVFSKLKNENLDHIFDQTRLLWQFEGEEVLDQFYVLSDASIGGKSTAKLEVSRNNKLLFHGRLSTAIPKDGESVRSGFCGFRTKPFKRSFNRKDSLDLDPFNTLSIKLKGDGRAFMVNIMTDSYFTITQDDIWSYFLFTRGGPYWQTVNIPFSKFFLTSRGRVQDNQSPFTADKVNGIGFTMADSIDGDFSLEVESIRAVYDPTHSEEFAYEKYYNPW